MKRARTEEAKDERRLALLRAALDEFFDRGFTAARMDDISKRAGLSKGALYLYFSSKDELFKSIVEEYAVPNVERIEAMTRAAPSALGGIEMIARFAPELIRKSDVPKLMKVLVGDATTFPEVVRAYRKTVLDRLLAALTALLARGHDAGEIHAPDPALTARLVIAPVALSGLWQVMFGKDKAARVDLDALFSLHVEMLSRALAPPKRARGQR